MRFFPAGADQWCILTMLVLACAGLLGGPCLSEDRPTADEKAVLALIGQLDSGDFEAREKASEELLKLGPAAKKALQDARNGGSPEARQRGAHIYRVLELREQLSQEIRSAYPGIEMELARDKGAWPKYFLLAGKTPGLPRADLDLLAAGALRSLQGLQDKATTEKVIAMILECKVRGAMPELIVRLKDEDASVRRSVAYTLGELGAQEAVPELIARLRDEEAEVRWRATIALGELGAKEAVPELLARLKDEDKYVRAPAALVLGKLGAKEAVPELLVRLNDEDENMRAYAATALGRLGAKEAVPKLLARLKDEDITVCWSAAYALGELGAKEAAPELLVKLNEKDANIREYAATALGRLGAKEAVPQLLALLKDEDEYVRASAARVLSEMGVKEAVPELVVRLKDEGATVRWSAAWSLGLLGAKEAVSELTVLAQKVHEDRIVRLFALGALACLGEDVDRTGLRGLLIEGNWSRACAFALLAKLKMKDAIPDISLYLDAHDPRLRAAASAALEVLKAP